MNYNKLSRQELIELRDESLKDLNALQGFIDKHNQDIVLLNHYKDGVEDQIYDIYKALLDKRWDS